MSKNAFDDLLRKKLDEQELPYQEEQWERLAGQLPSEKKRDRKFLFVTIALGTAAAIALLLASVLLYRFIDHTPAPEASHPMADTRMLPEADAAAGGQQPEKQAIASHPKQLPAGTLRENIALSPREEHETAVKSRTKPAPQTSPGKTIATLEPSSSPASQPVTQEKSAQPSPAIAVAPPSRTSDASSHTEKMHAAATTRNNQPLLPATTLAADQKTRIAVGAGMNYGTINAGYSIGVTAKHQLGNNFFVEGTVALMYNNNVNNSGNYSGPSNTAARPTFANIKNGPSSVFTPIQNLYYVQFNPSFGYQLGDRFSFSIGGDIQQLISGNDQKVLVRPDGLRYFPDLDFGVTGKTDFKVAPHIHAGLIFREGLNNFLLSQPDKYVNRRYFEVQFKYSIPVQ